MYFNHWLRAFPNLLAASAVIVALSTPAFAEGCCKHDKHGKHGKHEMPVYADLDANADGAVTSEEFGAFHAEHMKDRAEAGGKMKKGMKPPAFEDLDLDGDGNLSSDEFDKHHAQCPMMREHKKASDSESA